MYTRIASLKGSGKIYIVVPDQYTYVAEKNLFDMLDTPATSDISVCGLTRLSRRILDEAGAMPQLMDSAARSMMIRYAVDSCAKDLEAFSSVSHTQGFSQKLGVLFKEMMAGSVGGEELEEAAERSGSPLLASKAGDIRKLFETYRQLCEGTASDANGLSMLAAPAVKDAAFVSAGRFFFDGFNDFDTADYALIEELIRFSAGCCFTVCSGQEEIFLPAELMKERLISCASAAGKEVKLTETGEKKDSSAGIRYLERNYPLALPQRSPQDDGSVMCSRFDTPRDEVVYTASCINALIRRDPSMRYSDISVTVADPSLYSSHIRDVFGEYGIPCFMDSRRSIAFLPAVRSFLFLSGSLEHPSAEDMIALAKAFCTGDERDSVLTCENYVKRFGLSGKDFFSPFSADDPLEHWDIESAERIRIKVASMAEDASRSLSGASTIGDYTVSLYRYLEGSGFFSRIAQETEELRDENDHENANIYAQLYNRFMNIFEQLYTVFGHLDYGDGKTVRAMLTEALMNTEVGVIPSVTDRVSVGDPLRSRPDSVRVSFVLGAAEGALPDTGTSPAIFTDSEKLMLSAGGLDLSNTASYRYAKQNFVIYTLLTKPKERLFVSCVSDGEALMPSAVYEKLTAMFGEHRMELSLPEMMCTPGSALSALSVNLSSRGSGAARDASKDAVYDGFLEYFRKDPEKSVLAELALRGQRFRKGPVITDLEAYRALLKDPLETSISALERYAACPFSFFGDYVLRLTEQKDDSVGAADTGNVVHSVIENFSQRLLSGEIDLSAMDREDLLEEARTLTEKEMASYRGSIYTMLSSESFWREKLTSTASKAIEEIVSQMKRSDFLLSASEAKFDSNAELEPILIDTSEGRVLLRGKIDRIDTCTIGGREYVRIIDYKTGSTSFDMTKIYYGLSLQLPIYLRALTSDGTKEPAGMFYLRLSPPMTKVDKEDALDRVEAAVKEHFRLNGMVLRDLEVIEAMDRGYASGSTLEAVSTQKDGSIKASEKLQDTDFFQKLMEHSLHKAKEFSEGILRGEIPASPVKEGGPSSRAWTPCTYCGYRALCGHYGDEDGYRIITKKGAEDIR